LEFLLAGGNIFFDLCVHDVDFIRWALSDEVESVFATATCSSKELLKHGIQDNATMVLTFRKGTIVTITLSRWSCYGYDQRCEIFGEDGMVSVENEHKNTTILYNRCGEHHSRLKSSYGQRFKVAYANEMSAFCDTMLLKTPWRITQEDVIAVQKIAEAAKRACESNEIVPISAEAACCSVLNKE